MKMWALSQRLLRDSRQEGSNISPNACFWGCTFVEPVLVGLGPEARGVYPLVPSRPFWTAPQTLLLPLDLQKEFGTGRN